MDNKTKSERIHELLPRLLHSKNDSNWSALVGAIGEEDDRLATLITEVRNQFFVKTASRPYLDRLAANSNINRPKFIGMGDADFRHYVPVLSYQPKQVKQIIEKLLDLFFFKEATTAFLSSGQSGPFTLKDGWDLRFKVDNLHFEDIKFSAADFSDITAASTDEVVAAYNRQAKYSYATNFFDSVSEQSYIRLFTNTIGSEGSLEIIGGLANIGLELNGFMFALGTEANTQWNITKIGDSVTFTYTGGGAPGIDRLEVGDIFLCDLPGNEGSFAITAIDVQNAKFEFTNLFATVGSVTQTSSTQTKFLRPEKISAYRNVRRALAWETKAGQVTVEMPTTPSIVQRGLKGGFHVNGSTSLVTQLDSTTSLTVADASQFPASGQFVIEPVNSIVSRVDDEIVTSTSNGRLISDFIRYSYSGIEGNTLLGISPDLPMAASLHEVPVTSAVRVNGVMTCTADNNFKIGEKVIIRDSSGITVLSTTGTTTDASTVLSSVGDLSGVAPGQLVRGNGIPSNTQVLSINRAASTVTMSEAATLTGSGSISFSENTNGVFEITAVSPTSFTFNQLGMSGTVGTPGVASVERIELAGKDAKIVVTTARLASETQLTGPYVWDAKAPFVLSSHTATTVSSIVAGKTVKLLDVTTNTIPDESGFLIFDYGRTNQEGPVRYLYKAAEGMLALDPSYTFQQHHEAGCSVVALNHRGAHVISGLGNEYPPYLTNPSDARLILQDLIKSVTSAGIFVDFLVRYPTQLYGTISVYD